MQYEVYSGKIMTATLLDYIPRYAEEEGDFYSVAREELINALCSEKLIMTLLKIPLI